MSWKTLSQMDLKGKRVLTRVDLNVPIIDGKVSDATRIEKIVPTVNEIIKKGGTPILLSHMGRPKGERNPNLSLSQLQEKLENYFKSRVVFVADCSVQLCPTWGHINWFLKTKWPSLSSLHEPLYGPLITFITPVQHFKL